MAFQKQLLLPLWQCLQLQSVLLCCLLLFLQSCLVPVWGRDHAHTHHSHTTTHTTRTTTHTTHVITMLTNLATFLCSMCACAPFHGGTSNQPRFASCMRRGTGIKQCREEQNRTHDDRWLEGILQYNSKRRKDQSSTNHVRKQLGKIGNELGINPKIPTL